jgi:hypothetical protein
MDKIFRRFLIGEALDFSKPIINSIPAEDKPNEHYVKGFITFDVTKSEVAINNAIQKIKTDLDKKGLEVTGVMLVNVYGGASNYLNGPMNADFKNTNASDPFKIEKVGKSDKELSGEKNRDKNLGYATSRGNALKDAILKAFPSQGATSNVYARIMDTGGVIDEKRDVNLYPIPGQQAAFTLKLNVKQKEKEIPEFNAFDVFKQTESNRSGRAPSYYGSENIKIGGKDVLICKILSRNGNLGLKVDLPDIGLTKFQASISFDKSSNMYKITNNNGKEFTKQQWTWIYWYLTNDEKGNNNCKAIDYVELPSWLKSIDLSKVKFGATDKEHEFVHNKSKHDLVNENRNMKRVKLTEKDLYRIVRETLNEESRGENYMFFSNLTQMRRQLDIMIKEFDPNKVNDILNNGHDWADDHITEAKVNIDQVFDFFMNKLKGKKK